MSSKASKSTSKSTSFRLDKDLQKPVNDWLEHNPGFKASRLINMAVRQFITSRQVLTPVETTKASDEKAAKSAIKMMKKHAHMLEKLK
ncbi:MAG TPA: hypothetical protein VFF04_03225 [Candidatus Babeliales bacterium]|nr:hypothetical protein [Candidatus Babeliales bacterium]